MIIEKANGLPERLVILKILKIPLKKLGQYYMLAQMLVHHECRNNDRLSSRKNITANFSAYLISRF